MASSTIVAPPNLAKMSSTIRERAIRILEGLPHGEVFDWVDRVSIELTTQTLSTLLDFPFEEPDHKVAMWYISGNRDPDEIEDPDRFIIDRPRPRQHLSFGFGIHRCVGNRLAEMQLTILWEEILKRFPPIEVVEKPKRAYSNLIHGITEMKVRIPA